jgi:hypothetical protein
MIWLWTVVTTLAFAGPATTLEDRIVKAFSARDGAPPCATVQDWGPTEAVATAMREITETVTMPPWAPMRAAECVVLNASTDAKAWSLVQNWMTGEETAGYAMVVVQNLPALTEKRALVVADLAVKRSLNEPRFGRLASTHLRASTYPSVVKFSDQLKQP